MVSKDGSPWREDAVSLHLNCNDVFAWGCADAEDVLHSDLADIYDHFVKDNKWGTAVWCIKRRKMRAQKPVYDEIKKEGIWDLDAIYKELGI